MAISVPSSGNRHFHNSEHRKVNHDLVRAYTGLGDTKWTSDVIDSGCIGTLSAQLRSHTAALHEDVERQLRLPDGIRTRQDYCRLLGRFFGLYEPLERSFARFEDWYGLGLSPCFQNHSYRLARDLCALEIELREIHFAPKSIIPQLPTFAHALGALYVLEGSALGGRIILREFDPDVKLKIVGATHFLNGHNAETGTTWPSFKSTLDDFGRTNPQQRFDVLIGAQSVFRAILSWFSYECVPGRP
jgi:heme oxygenase